MDAISNQRITDRHSQSGQQTREVQKEAARLARLKDEGKKAFEQREKEVSHKRLTWWEDNRERLERQGVRYLSVLDRAYRIFYIEYLGLNPKEVPIVERTAQRLVIHSRNYCPVEQACNSLGLDTREICKAIYEQPVTDLLRQIHPGLRFHRNYDAIRPHTWYCEEIIELSRIPKP
jgi:hypothetical protein